jgi:hypothetical protein
MDLLIAGTEFIIVHHERALAVSFLFLSLALAVLTWSSDRTAARILIVPAVAWAVFAAMEWEANREGAYIRLDLFLTWPGIWLITVLSAAFCIARLRRAAVKQSETA